MTGGVKQPGIGFLFVRLLAIGPVAGVLLALFVFVVLPILGAMLEALI